MKKPKLSLEQKIIHNALLLFLTLNPGGSDVKKIPLTSAERAKAKKEGKEYINKIRLQILDGFIPLPPIYKRKKIEENSTVNFE